MLALSVVDHGFEPRSGQTNDYKIGNCCFSAKHAALRRKNKDCLASNQDNVSELGDMSIHRLLFQWISTIKIQLSVQGSPHIVKTGRLDFSLSWHEGEVRENLGDFRKSIQILTFLSLLPHVPLPFTKTNNDLKRMQLTSLE